MELSIDTSTRYASVAVSRDGDVLVELSWRSEQNHSVELAPAIRQVMSRAGTEMKQLRAIFVARGPGGFSALRVGMSTAKAMAVALRVPLVSIGTLDVEAAPYLGVGLPVKAVIGAGRSRLYVGTYMDTAPPRYEVLGLDDFIASVSGPAVLCGEGVWAAQDALRERLGRNAPLASVPPPTRLPSVLSRLAHDRLRAGETDDPVSLQPLYLRSSQVDVANRRWASA